MLSLQLLQSLLQVALIAFTKKVINQYQPALQLNAKRVLSLIITMFLPLLLNLLLIKTMESHHQTLLHHWTHVLHKRLKTRNLFQLAPHMSAKQNPLLRDQRLTIQLTTQFQIMELITTLNTLFKIWKMLKLLLDQWNLMINQQLMLRSKLNLTLSQLVHLLDARPELLLQRQKNNLINIQ